ncbi:DUF424 family protein [Candidatus Pacearchaeota archaeon]|nr:DUF424 family protein [Candidatus Pacearchaeota archaeon]
MISINIIRTYREVVAICDSNLLGKVFEEEKLQLDLKESFYKGEEVDEQKAIEIMRDMLAEDATFNIAGKESVNAALKAGIIEEESVGEIAGIPFALVLL